VPIFNDHGRIKPPVTVPDIQLVRQDGSAVSLGKLVAGHATAVQLMFTSCSTTCPIQAAIFQRVQTLVPEMAAQGIQLLSLSVDPAMDTPQALSAWRERFHAGPNWIAAAPRAKDGPLVQSFFGRASGGFADHSTQVNIVDRRGRLVWRTIELPTAEEIAGVLQKL
jgi:protein SCO1/2